MTAIPLALRPGLRRSFGRVRVLRDIDLTLSPGEALAVAGPNGAGKTTLLRLLAGLMRPSAGEVRVLGRSLAADAAELAPPDRPPLSPDPCSTMT